MNRCRLPNKVLSFLVCVVIVLILLTACAPAVNTTAVAPSPASSAAAPKYGNTLKIALRDALTSMDSFIAGGTGVSTYAISKTFGQTLTRWTGKSDREAGVAPLLAKSWEVNPDGVTWTFHLQQGVNFQNVPPLNGREITADDWVYHISRIMNPANKQATRFAFDVKTVSAIDKYTLKIVTNSKSPGLLAYLCHGASMPYPKEVVEAAGGAEKNNVGTGAFTLTEFSNVKAILKKNPNYWEKGKPYLDSVEFYYMPDASARLAAFRAGQIDVLPIEGKANRDGIERTVSGAQIQDGLTLREAGLVFNNTRTPFDNKLVRQAIQYAIDYNNLIAGAIDGAGTRTGYLAPWYSEYGAKQVSDLPKRDIAKAKMLLAQAGYPDGFKTTIMQNTGVMETLGNAVEPIVAMLKEVGIQATIVPLDSVSFTSKWRNKDYDMAVHTLYTARPFDPNLSLMIQWPTKSTYNYLGYSNPNLDELVQAQLDAFPNKEKRIPIIKQILAILEEDVPSIPLYVQSNYFIQQPWVKGWNDMADPHAAYATGALPGVWVDRGN